MRAIVLAAGLGTRLGALSDERPKPLLPVADQPLIRYGLALLAGHGIREAAVNLHHLGDEIVEELRDLERPTITWSREPDILGTGGALVKMGDWLTQGGTAPFLVLNGKLVIDVDLTDLLHAHRASGALATMVVREVADATRWGAIDIDEGDHVLGILETKAPCRTARRTMFTGVHVVSSALLARLPAGASCVIRQGYRPALANGASISAYRYDGYFEEHSTAERYLAGNFAVLEGRAKLRFAPGPLGGVDASATIGQGVVLAGPHRIGPRATIGDGAKVGPFAVVGRGANVAPGAIIRRSVVWPGARAEGQLEGAIVTPRQVARVSLPRVPE